MTRPAESQKTSALAFSKGLCAVGSTVSFDIIILSSAQNSLLFSVSLKLLQLLLIFATDPYLPLRLPQMKKISLPAVHLPIPPVQ